MPSRRAHPPAVPLIALLIVLLAAATHLLGSSGWPVWTDEGWTAWATADPNPASVVSILAGDRHPPLYFILLGLWRALAGESRLALRALSIFSGILSTAALYRLGAGTFGARAGRFAAALFAVLPVAVYFTRAARHYSLLVLLAILSTLLLRRAWRAPSLPRLVAYGLSAALLLYTHYQAVFLLGAHALIILLLPARARWRLLGALALAGLAFTPWALVILNSQGVGEIARASTGATGTYTTTPADLLALGGVLFGGQLALLGGAFLLGAGPILAGRREPGRLLVLLAGGGLLLVMIAGNLLTGLLTDRTTVMLAPFLLAVAGAGLAGLPARAGRVLTGAAVAVMLAAPGVIQPSLPLDKIAAALAADYSPGDLIVLETGWDDRASAYELSLALPPGAEADIIATLPWVDHIGEVQPALPFVQPALEGAARVWVVQWLQAPTVLPYLDDPASGFRRVITHTVPTGPLYAARYPDHPVITAALFERLEDTNAAGITFGGLFALEHALLPESAAPGAA
ncbi:MAG: glycosyltransferase family 39 protein, partial [Anaerolineae bacterium]|nr:glycosyltransferase family 39 protein [Anaerolineae bacterium]